MTYSEKARLIDRISWGSIIADATTQDDQSISFVLTQPTAEDKARAVIIYERAHLEAIMSGMDTEREAIDMAIELGQWDRKTEDVVIPGIKDDIHKIKRGLLDLIYQKDRLEQARSTLRRAEEVLLEKLTERHALLTGTAEAHALFQQQSYMISRIAKDEDGKNYWPSREIFDEETDIELIRQLVAVFFEQSSLPISVARELARTDPWRIFWSSAKDRGDLFDRSSVEWSSAQKELVEWSYVYDMVQEAYDKPSKMIIADDDLLDSWFIRQEEKSENKGAKDDLGGQSLQSKRRGGRQEQFIMADAKGAKDVYALNDVHTRAKIRAKQKFLSKQGIVEEQNLPESQMEMRQMAANAQTKKVKDISRR